MEMQPVSFKTSTAVQEKGEGVGLLADARQ